MRTKLLFIFTLTLFITRIYAGDSIQRIDKNIEITKLTNNSYLIKSSFANDGKLIDNHLLIIDNKDIVLVNTPTNDSLTGIMLNLIERMFNRPVTKVIVSHFHDDSSGGLKETFKQGIVSYGLNKTQNLLMPEGKNIDIVFKDSLTIPLQTIKVELLYFGPGHSVDNIIVWLPNEKILFGGCLLKSLSAHDKGNIKDADLKSWAGTVLKVKEHCKNPKIVIPGHFEIGDSALLDHTIKLVTLK